MSIYLVILIALIIIIGVVVIPKDPYPGEPERDANFSVPQHINCRCIDLPLREPDRLEDSIAITIKAIDGFNRSAKRASLAADILIQSLDGSVACNTEEFAPFEAGRIAYGLGRGEEDNPYRDDEELGIEWEAGYCKAFKQDKEEET